ncbi:ACP S-malonyltransferase [Marinicrinis sediminis]|uniref:[acyl-carrier-protein] S-malonyltransferase n=1 Tax=Marinicrinis sediminis TaxID=1652465 RepID=A0ABW5R9M1_9BACL
MNKLALLFPGQGAQFVGMGQTLHERYDAVKKVFKQANEVLGYDLRQLCLEGPAEDLNKTACTQPALLALGFATYQVYREEIGIEPTLAAGHSLGEITALTCSGAMAFEDALRIVHRRGELMQEAAGWGQGTMAAVIGLDRNVVEDICLEVSDFDQFVVLSNINSSKQLVISGHQPALAKAESLLKDRGAQVTYLSTSAPFHSPVMQPAAEALSAELARIKYSPLQWPVYANATARPYEDESQIASLLTRQMTAPVPWLEIMQHMQTQGLSAAVDMGPKPILANLVKHEIPLRVYAIDKEKEWDELKQHRHAHTLGGRPTTSTDPSFLGRCMALAVCTKNENWDHEAYEEGVVKPYQRIKKLDEELEQLGLSPSPRHMEEGLLMLRSVMETKKLPAAKQAERIAQLLDETRTRPLFPSLLTPIEAG